MIIIETCPKCGSDLQDYVITTFPAIPKKVCPNCGWKWEGIPEQPIRVPFVEEHRFRVWDSIPPSCVGCSNHPSNGGTGICNCVLGDWSVTC